MSRLTTRIMAIMLFPLAIFLVGLLSLDQYRTTLIQSEFVALERQGFTLARSLALAEAAREALGAARGGRDLGRRGAPRLRTPRRPRPFPRQALGAVPGLAGPRRRRSRRPSCEHGARAGAWGSPCSARREGRHFLPLSRVP